MQGPPPQKKKMEAKIRAQWGKNSAKMRKDFGQNSGENSCKKLEEQKQRNDRRKKSGKFTQKGRKLSCIFKSIKLFENHSQRTCPNWEEASAKFGIFVCEI